MEGEKDDDPSNTVWAFGWNKTHQLGLLRTREVVLSPVINNQLSQLRISRISAGLNHSAAITDIGSLYTWGKGTYGRLGSGEERDLPVPTLVKALREVRIVSVSCGHYHTAALATNSVLYTFGRNSKGQLGLGTHQDQCTPTEVTSLRDKHITLISCGGSHSLAAAGKKGHVYAFGLNDVGQLGLGSEVKEEASPKQVRFPHKGHGPLRTIANIACGFAHSGVVFRDDQGASVVFMWGQNDCGQITVPKKDRVKNNDFSVQFEPRLIPREAFQGRDVAKLMCGHAHTVCLSETGEVYAWGLAEHGELGLGALQTLGGTGSVLEKARVHFPVRVKEALFKQRVIDLACGEYHTIVLTDDGEVFTFGLNDYGQLGCGSTRDAQTPSRISSDGKKGLVMNNKVVTHIAAGGRHSFAANSYRPVIRLSDSTMSGDFRQILENGELCDLTFVLADKAEIRAHAVVVARTEQLQSLILGGKRADNEDAMIVVHLSKSVKETVFKKVLQYIYTDEITMLSEYVPDIKRLARQFGLQELVYRCEVHEHALPSSMFSHTLGQSLAHYLSTGEFSDITFLVEGQEVKAHKCVLVARCPRFHGMFLGQFIESSLSQIPLDIPFVVFSNLLEYIYTDQVQYISGDVVVELLMVSNEYTLSRLREMCEVETAEGLDVENAAWLFEIADTHKCKQLKAFCKYFIRNHYPKVSETEAFANLSKDLQLVLGGTSNKERKVKEKKKPKEKKENKNEAREKEGDDKKETPEVKKKKFWFF